MRYLPAALIAVLAACGGSDASTATRTAPQTVAPRIVTLDGPLVVDNQGGDMEGHTPRGFAGSGTGLFAGDNLNDGFPDGEGIQILLTFDVGVAAVDLDRATLRSDAMTIRGDPFGDLGDLLVEPVVYDEFDRTLFDLVASGAAERCERVGDNGVECDVTAAVELAMADGSGRTQFRLVFERHGDRDGEKDLALFFRTDSNTNEPGIFTLELR